MNFLPPPPPAPRRDARPARRSWIAFAILSADSTVTKSGHTFSFDYLRGAEGNEGWCRRARSRGEHASFEKKYYNKTHGILARSVQVV
ncbi:hypothetical protein EVAR_72778_1 [Eumeta japonica]|uniref:Uncharacterized protein n=1 Tax=Eumeta variegata TaxID=151549 RepID=A0A4C2AHT0_EUMVA|nr:hypothetical protein EVAR_72778_1 [Eumeta japonica]